MNAGLSSEKWHVRQPVLIVLLAVIATILLAACGSPSSVPTPDLQATEGAIRAQLVATMTAEAPSPEPTPLPTETPTPTPAATPTPLPPTATLTSTPAKAFHWTQYDYVVDILENGDLLFEVTMGFSFDSGSFSQGYYAFEMARLDDVRDVRVYEGSQAYTQVGSELVGGYQLNMGDEFEVLWWFLPTANAERTFTLTYRVVGGLRIYEDGDQFYWNFYAGDRSGLIDSGTITLRLPVDVPLESLQTAVDPPDVPLVQVDGRTLQAQVTGLVGYRAVVLRVQFPHGLVQADPAPWQLAEDQARALAPTPTATLSPEVDALLPFTLQLADLPPGFSLYFQEAVTAEDVAASRADPQAALAEYQAQGRGPSLVREYRRQPSLADLLTGPVTIRSQVIQYESSEGAKRGLDYMMDAGRETKEEEISVQPLGEASAGLRQTVSEDDMEWIVYTVIVQKGTWLTKTDTLSLAAASSIDTAMELTRMAVDRLP